MPFRFAHGRPPAVALDAMVATSQPLATRAGLRILERGGNAADAAIAAAAVLSVTEPMSTGIGGDCFSLVWRDGTVEGLDSAGPAPAAAELLEPVAERGPLSVTVPGAVAGWAALAERHGRLGLAECLADAITTAEQGFAVAPITAEAWGSVEAPDELGPVPKRGERVRFPELAATLRSIAADGPRAFYEGRVAQAIVAASWLDEGDLALIRVTLGRAAPDRLPGPRGRRASSTHAGRRGTRGTRIAPRDDTRPPEQDRLRPPGARGRTAPRAGRRRRGRSPRSCVSRPAPGRDSVRGDRASRGNRLPLRGRRRPDGGVVHPEPLHGFRLGRGRAGDGSRAPESRRLLFRERPRRAGTAPLPHDHPRNAPEERRAARAVRRHGRLHPGPGARPARRGARRRRPRSAGGARRASVSGRG